MALAGTARRVGSAYRAARDALSLPALRFPVVIFHSDDWGRTGAPDLNAVLDLQAHHALEVSPWNLYGLETRDDLERLSELLSRFRDSRGETPRFVANFITANLELRKMLREGFKTLHLLQVSQGFPDPWHENLAGTYREMVARRIFVPGFHGFTHFCYQTYARHMRAGTELGQRIRLLAERDIPYLAQCTPELNFALVERLPDVEERFLKSAEQAEWMDRGLSAFRDLFDRSPLTACFPGYRGNQNSVQLLTARGARIFQWSGLGIPAVRDGAWHLYRNLSFEPALNSFDLDQAVSRAEALVEAGVPIIICSHSINYLQRHTGMRERSLFLLETFLAALLSRLPDVRFSDDEEYVAALEARLDDWCSTPTVAQVHARVKLMR